MAEESGYNLEPDKILLDKSTVAEMASVASGWLLAVFQTAKNTFKNYFLNMMEVVEG